MSPVLRAAWSIFAGLCLLVMVGAIGWHAASHTVQARIDLIPGARVTMHVFRLANDAPRLSISFKDSAALRPPTPYWPTRPELGEWRALEGNGSLRFENPGETVKLRVFSRSDAGVYEALPVSGRSEGLKHRDLVPSEDDGDPKRFRWPPLLPTKSIPAGQSALDILVLEVGDAIKGESVTVVVQPPLGFKSEFDGAIRWLWYFCFWPIYALTLGITGMMLAYITRKASASGR